MADYNLGTARGRIEIDATGAKTGIDAAGKSASELEGKTKGAGMSAAALGLSLVGIGTAALGAFGYAVKVAADFEKTLSGFKAVTGATAEQLDQVRQKALQLGADTKFSAAEAADAMVELGKQGLSVDQIMGGAADATTALAAAGEIALPEAAGIAAAALNQFKLSASELPHVADLLAGAANASATGVSELGLALSYVGPTAKAVGLSIEDTTSALALFANNGIDANKAGTALRSILSRLVPASKPAANSMRELGLITADGKNQFFDATGKVKSFAEVIDILNGATKNLTAEQKINALQNIFGTEALSAANVMAAETAGTFGDLSKRIGDVKAWDVANERMNNLAGSMEQLRGSVETTLIKAGSQFQLGVKGIVDGLTKIVNFLGDLNPDIQKWIGYLVAGGGAAAVFVGGLILIVDAVEKTKGAFAALNFVMQNNPLVRFITIAVLVAAALYGLYKNVEGFRNVVDGAWEKVQPFIDGLREFFTGSVVPAAQNFWKTLTDGIQVFIDAWNGMQVGGGDNNFFTSLANAAKTIRPIFDNMVEGVGRFVAAWNGMPTASTDNPFFKLVTLLGAGLRVLWDTAQQVAPVLANMFGGAFGSAVSWLVDTAVPAIINGFTSFANFITNTALPAIEHFASFAQEQLGLFFGWLQANVGPVVTALGELFSAWLVKVQAAFEAAKIVIGVALVVIGAIIGAAVAAIVWVWTNFGDKILAVITIVWDLIKGVVEGALQVIRGIINVITGIISGDWGKVWEGIVNILQGVWNVMWAIVSSALELIWNTIKGIGSVIAAIWSGIWDLAANILSSKWNEIKNAVSEGINTVVGWISGLKDRIAGAFSGIDLFGAGRRIMESFFNGLKAIWGDIQNFVGGIGSWIKDHKGPAQYDAKLLVENGQLIMKGLGEGLKDGLRAVEGILGGVTDSIPGMVGTTTNNSSNTTVNITVNGGDGASIAGAFDNNLLSRITQAARAR